MLKEAGRRVRDHRPLGAAPAVRRDRRDREPQDRARRSPRGLTPIVCIGETLDERDGNETLTVLDRQIKAGPRRPHRRSDRRRWCIAYEPVWAIGTGRNATPAQAGEAHAHIRARLRQWFGGDRGRSVPHHLRRQRQAGQHPRAGGAGGRRRRAGRRRQPRRPQLLRNRLAQPAVRVLTVLHR